MAVPPSAACTQLARLGHSALPGTASAARWVTEPTCVPQQRAWQQRAAGSSQGAEPKLRMPRVGAQNGVK